MYIENNMKYVENKRAIICVHTIKTAREKKRRVETQKKRRSKLVADHVEVGDGAESGPEH